MCSYSRWAWFEHISTLNVLCAYVICLERGLTWDWIKNFCYWSLRYSVFRFLSFDSAIHMQNLWEPSLININSELSSIFAWKGWKLSYTKNDMIRALFGLCLPSFDYQLDIITNCKTNVWVGIWSSPSRLLFFVHVLCVFGARQFYPYLSYLPMLVNDITTPAANHEWDTR